MRRVLALILVTVALPLHASWWPSWSESLVRMAVGDTATVRVQARWSGLVDYGGGIHWTFRSDREDVALAFVEVNTSQPYDVRIDAVGPGAATIRRLLPNGFFEQSYVRIEVSCGNEPPLVAAAPVVRGHAGRPSTLEAITPIAHRTAFDWYLGDIGDRSRPLPHEGPKLTFTPSSYGTAKIWVQGTTPCSVSTAAFRIETEPSRPRAVR